MLQQKSPAAQNSMGSGIIDFPQIPGLWSFLCRKFLIEVLYEGLFVCILIHRIEFMQFIPLVVKKWISKEDFKK